MKKLLIGLFVLISISASAQKWETIKGNGEVKKETREVSSFTSLASQGSMNVQISYGNSNSITVEADENLLPYIETKVEDGQLMTRPKKNVNLKSKSKMNVYVSMTKINSLKLSGSGNINGDGAFMNDSKTDMAVSGSGNLTLTFDKFKDLDLAIAGSGNIDLKGNATNSISAQISGSGNIDCSNINSNDVDAKISGSGNVFYKGNAPKITSKVAGSGKVLKM